MDLGGGGYAWWPLNLQVKFLKSKALRRLSFASSNSLGDVYEGYDYGDRKCFQGSPSPCAITSVHAVVYV